MILAVGNTKSGVGKTTVAINLAIARALSGRDVWLIDGDSRGTAQTAIRIRFGSGKKPGVACSAYPDGTIMRAQINQQGPKYEDIVIDVGARDSTAQRAALVLADVLLVPFQPRGFDAWALSDIASLIDEVNGVRDGLRSYAILNMADPADTADNVEAAETVADFPQLTYLPTTLRRRKSFANAAAAGMCVFELRSRNDKDAKANDELNALYEAVFREVRG
jgi:chromosome partitioning protein